MAKKTYTVTVLETTHQFLSKSFEAESETDAREQAEADDWRTWEKGHCEVDVAIEEVDPMDLV